MKSAGTWKIALGVAVVASVVLIVVVAVLSGPVQKAEENDHFTSFAPTTVMVVASGEGKHRCADVYNCQCAEASGAPTCGVLNHEGVCSAGTYCCREETYRCGKSRCTRCAEEVSNRRCMNRIGSCYNTWVTVTYTPDSPVPPSLSQSYQSCLNNGGSTSSCAPLLTLTNNVSDAMTCGYNNRACATSYLAEYPAETSHAGTYSLTTPSNVYLHGTPAFEPSAGLIAGIAVCSLCMCCSFCAVCGTSVMLCNAKRDDQRRARAAVTTNVAPTGGGGVAMTSMAPGNGHVRCPKCSQVLAPPPNAPTFACPCGQLLNAPAAGSVPVAAVTSDGYPTVNSPAYPTSQPAASAAPPTYTSSPAYNPGNSAPAYNPAASYPAAEAPPTAQVGYTPQPAYSQQANPYPATTYPVADDTPPVRSTAVL